MCQHKTLLICDATIQYERMPRNNTRWKWETLFICDTILYIFSPFGIWFWCSRLRPKVPTHSVYVRSVGTRLRRQGASEYVNTIHYKRIPPHTIWRQGANEYVNNAKWEGIKGTREQGKQGNKATGEWSFGTLFRRQYVSTQYTIYMRRHNTVRTDAPK